VCGFPFITLKTTFISATDLSLLQMLVGADYWKCTNNKPSVQCQVVLTSEVRCVVHGSEHLFSNLTIYLNSQMALIGNQLSAEISMFDFCASCTMKPTNAHM
jgi:hypothetical protein